MTLQGNLETLSVVEVLRLLATTGKTGCLRVESDGSQATVWLRQGRLTAAATDRVPKGPYEEVVGDVLRYEKGSFVFDVDDRAPDGDGSGPGPDDIDDLLDRGGALLREWEELRVAVPSLDHQVALNGDLAEGHVTITARQWPVLSAVAGGCSVGELAAALGLTELGVLRTLDDLQALGLTRIESPRPARSRRRAGSTRLA